jgi:PadR family transcriptional regulator, regulatory protein PadR
VRDPQWLRGLLPLLVLAVLDRGERYGSELTSELEAAGVGAIKGGTLYPMLARLERDGWVAIRWAEPTSGPARKYYRLTPEGRDQFRAGATTWLAFAEHATTLLRSATQEADHGTT